MNALIASATSKSEAGGSRPLLGFGNVARKDIGDWRHGRRVWVVLLVSAIWFAGTAAAAWINNWVRLNLPPGPGETPPQALPMDPLTNLIVAAGSSFSVIVAIFATMSVLLTEREAGTLAWTASKPVSRASIVLSTWSVTSAALWIASVVLPLVVTVGLVAVLYGAPPLGAAVALAITLGAATMLYAAIAIAAATVVPSQAGVAGIGLAVFFVPSLVIGIVPAIAPVLPTSIVAWGLATAAGGPITFVTPVAWLVAVVAVLWFARARFAGQDL
jgi:ABC-type transport system involved in multi-copper enzyme maturation permease subunit